jgi:hypothetical protein
VLRALAAVVALVSLAAAGFTAAALGGRLVPLPETLAWDESTRSLALLTGALALLALAFLLASRWARRRAARRRSAALVADARRALASVVDELLVSPSLAVLEEHRAVREAAALATDPVVRPAVRPVARHSSSSSTDDEDDEPSPA